VECSPCLLRECPIDHRCMTRVGVDRVAAAALELVGS
jgi:heptosyltransferase-2